MNPIFMFVLGLLVGWLIEWLIDFFYWRKRCAEREETSRGARTSESIPAEKIVPDDLQVIKGIGPVIEGLLNDAGIYTFEQLGNLTNTQLEDIVGDLIERLADEEGLIKQARELANRKLVRL